MRSLNNMKSIIKRIVNIFSDEFPKMLFDKDMEKKNQISVWIWLFIVYIIGIMLWGVLFDWRKTSLNFHDWHILTLPRYEAIRDALHYRMLPLHVDCEYCLHTLTDRFLVLPDVITTPQMLVLSFVDVDTFALLDLLLHYTLATLSLLILRRKMNLSLIAYTFLFFLFNFNGYVQVHYAVGHMSWGAYFLFPFYFLLFFEILDKSPSWKWVTKISFLSLYIILAGSQHHFTWLMLFLIFFALARPSLFKWIFIAILFSGFLSAVRLLPPTLGLNDFTSFSFRFRTGYHTLSDLMSTFISIQKPDFSVPDIYKYTHVGYWEFDYFVSFIGVVFIIYFGVIDWVLKNGGRFKNYMPLLMPALAIFLLSQGNIYQYTFFNFPIFSSERIASRMISLPITFFMIMAAAQFQDFLDKYKSSAFRWLTFSTLILLIHELYTHAVIWNVEALGKFFGTNRTQFPGNSIINHPDPEYTTILIIGLIITLISAIVLAVFVYKEKHKAITTQ